MFIYQDDVIEMVLTYTLWKQVEASKDIQINS